MKAGLVSYGAYIPKSLVRREDIAKAWDFPSIPGTKAVANSDEDSLTMAVEAGADCLKGFNEKLVDGLFFASTTCPFLEKSASSIISTALDMREDIITMDFTNSLRGATTAFITATDMIEAGKAKTILVIASDMRNPEPATMYEYAFGDAAAAILVSSENKVMEIVDHASRTEDLIGPWRRPKDDYVRQCAGKYDELAGYTYNVGKVIKDIAAKTRVDLAKLGKACIYGSDPRSPAKIGKANGIPSKAVCDNMFQILGDTGVAQVFMTLIASLKKVKEEELVLLVGYGDGADAVLMKVLDKQKVKDLKRAHRGYMINSATAEAVDVYTKYITFRNSLKKEPFKRRTSTVSNHREGNFILRMHGVKCKACGTVQYPIWRSCIEPKCQATDQLEEVKLQKRGKIFTLILDHLEGGNYFETPIPRCVIDLEGGGRILLNMTDCVPKDVKIGMDVEMTFRKVHEGGEFPNYYWKCRPIRERAVSEEEEGTAPRADAAAAIPEAM
ncbi:MAG: hydroxymethylglutaryl-CoA synthase family protein [Candidatus Lokiarchaeota archaeon]|nr:hydroxymethylglutaryl-CoA synthase family protein [Candidatus Lokiarchaeota archaeon]